MSNDIEKFEKERSKVGLTDLNASFSNNSEAEREKTTKRPRFSDVMIPWKITYMDTDEAKEIELDGLPKPTRKITNPSVPVSDEPTSRGQKGKRKNR
jgi:hypothetical protein